MYLTEQGLGEVLEKIFPQYEFIHNKVVPSCNFKFRPDYRSEELGLIVEFDGYQHYTKSKVIMSDYEKDYLWSEILGYKVIRVPYFVQICNKLLEYEFGIQTNFNQVYDHGFIDSKACLPADFCEAGYRRFLEDLDRFFYAREDILLSLNQKVEQRNEPYTVVPSAFIWPSKIFCSKSGKTVEPYVYKEGVDFSIHPEQIVTNIT
jgi:hypothetical protein